jgi:hypothetical protein
LQFVERNSLYQATSALEKPHFHSNQFFFFGEYKSGHCSKVITHIPMPEVLDRLRASLFINWDKLEHGWIPSNEIGTHLGFIFHG